MTEAVSGTDILLSDDFNKNGPIDSSTWRYSTGPSSFLGGTTQMRPELPVAESGYLKLQFDTYNSGQGGPSYGGNPSFYGSEAISQQTFAVGDGIAFEARVRLPVAEDGLIGGFFSYGFDSGTNTRDEIDWEFIPKRGLQNPQTNIFNNTPPDGEGNWKAPTLDGVLLTDFHTYRIEWLPNAVRWLVDGEVVRTERGAALDKQMALHLNLWGAGDTWDTGSKDLTFAKTPGQNRTFFMEVDYAHVEQLATVVGDHGHNRLLGSDHSEWIIGRGGNDIIRGGHGDDTISGGRESDDDGGDELGAAPAGPGISNKHFDEQLYGGGGDDVLGGGGGAEWLTGGSGNDIVRGGSGDDAIIGGRGIDRSFGGEGADQFIYRSVQDARPGEQLDRILDFHPRWGDKIDLSKIDANVGMAGNQAFDFIGDAQFSADPQHAGELRYETVKNGIRVEADVDGDGEADMAFLVKNVSSLSVEDVIL